MPQKHSRMVREQHTIEAMIDMYCHDHHRTGDEVCRECKELLDYAAKRLDQCPFQENKTTCANCKVHCYKPAMREKVRKMMRYAGPRMISRHPILALFHFIYGLRNEARPITKKPSR
ncbi:MAG TPA: nitrous oxide-stimulated promoter family protein [Nitrospiraceae bacterium]|nr:nitrous oxide-stimulated promoter family protein [Nitrospiraceae bacterium]